MNFKLDLLLNFLCIFLDFFVISNIFIYFSTILKIFWKVGQFGLLKVFGPPNLSRPMSLDSSARVFKRTFHPFFLISLNRIHLLSLPLPSSYLFHLLFTFDPFLIHRFSFYHPPPHLIFHLFLHCLQTPNFLKPLP